MSTISIRKVLNLFKRKNNKYTSDITHSSGSESNICIASRPNITWCYDNPSLLNNDTMMDTITIKIETTEDISDIYTKILDIKSSIPNIKLLLLSHYGNDASNKYKILMTISLYDILLVKDKLIDKLDKEDNNYITYILSVCDLYNENMKCYDFSEKSFELIENTHKSCRVDAATVSRQSIEFLGYTWPNKEDCMCDNDLISTICYAYISIDVEKVHYFNHLPIVYYDCNDIAVIKINLHDLIAELNNKKSLLAGHIKDILLKTIYADKTYFKHIIQLLENLPEYIEQFVEDIIDDEEEDSEFDQEELYNSLVDEILK